MAAATSGSPPTQGFAPPRARRGRALAAGAAPPGSTVDGDEAMTDDMRLAVSALGLMRDGPAGSDGTVAPLSSSSSSSASLPPPSTSSAAGGSVFALPPVPSRYRSASSSRRSDPSRSTSTASTASASEAWTGATSDTGYSSPAGSASFGVSGAGGHGAGDDTDMLADKRAHHPEDETGGDPRFMARVSQLPVVSSGIEWYERSKANSRVVKYGAGLVESSLSAVSRPVANALPPLGPLDDFACRQLDRIGAPGASPGRGSPAMPLPLQDGDDEMRGGRAAAAAAATSPLHRGGGGGEYEMAVGRAGDERGSSAGSGSGQQVATVGSGGGGRSRWQTVLLEAGGLGAAVSEESLKSLRYCLQWLLYATAHLDHQISTLRDFILSLRAHTHSSSQSSSNALVAASASAHLAQIKHDVVETIRKVVDVMSKYAGAALPEQAKRYVRQSILGLPVKWASAIEGRGSASGRATRESTVDGSELGTPRPERMGDAYFPGAHAPAGGPSLSAAAGSDGDAARRSAQDPALRPTEEAADRILTFAVESLDMLRSVTGIFGESVERAEAWIERLRVVGLDRQRQRAAASETSPDEGVNTLPPPQQVGSSATFDDGAAPALAIGTKRRRTTPTSSLASSMHVDLDGAAACGDSGASTAWELGQATSEGDDGAATRRKRGAWHVDADDAGAAA